MLTFSLLCGVFVTGGLCGAALGALAVEYRQLRGGASDLTLVEDARRLWLKLEDPFLVETMFIAADSGYRGGDRAVTDYFRQLQRGDTDHLMLAFFRGHNPHQRHLAVLDQKRVALVAGLILSKTETDVQLRAIGFRWLSERVQELSALRKLEAEG